MAGYISCISCPRRWSCRVELAILRRPARCKQFADAMHALVTRCALLTRCVHRLGEGSVAPKARELSSLGIASAVISCTLGLCATELAITAVGLVQGVTYRLLVSVAQGGDIIHSDETSFTWSREMAAASGDVHVFWHVLPPLTSGPHTVRATLQDAAAGDDGESELASMVQQLHPIEDLDASARCAGQNPSEWKKNASAFRVWLARSKRDAAISSLLENVPAVSDFELNLHASGDWNSSAGRAERKSESLRCGDMLTNLPLAVMSQPHDHERRRSMSRLLSEIGFRNVTFPATTKWTDMDVEQMIADGILSTSLFSRMEE